MSTTEDKITIVRNLLSGHTDALCGDLVNRTADLGGGYCYLVTHIDAANEQKLINEEPVDLDVVTKRVSDYFPNSPGLAKLIRVYKPGITAPIYIILESGAMMTALLSSLPSVEVADTTVRISTSRAETQACSICVTGDQPLALCNVCSRIRLCSNCAATNEHNEVCTIMRTLPTAPAPPATMIVVDVATEILN